MSFKTNAGTNGADYGVWRYDQKTKTSTFIPLGKKVTIDWITDNIETGEARLSLSFDYQGESKRVTVSRKELADNTLVKTLAEKGADVTKKNFDILVDTLRKQEETMELNGIRTEKVYDHLGWIHLPTFDEAGIRCGSALCYRCYTLLGGIPARYAGNYTVACMGSFDVWRDMVKAEVIGNAAMEIVLIAGLAAVVNGLIGPITSGENPIVHLCCASSQGKSTALMLAASAFGEPFDGERKAYGKTGEIVTRCSIYASWGATENATIAQCAGNKGAVIVLNELGKFKGGDMSRIVYDLSEGTDKARLNKNLETHKTEGYSTTILSAGEISLLGRCKDKLEGLQNRVMEIEQPLTNSAENSRSIKEVCRKHNGWAAPKLAQYILDNGGVELVLPTYESFRQELTERLPDSSSKERFIEKFAALFLTTAVLANAALGIQFSLDALVAFFAEYEAGKGKERNVAASSYDAIICACRTYKRNFYVKRSKSYW